MAGYCVFKPGNANHPNSVWPLYTGKQLLADKIAFCEQQYAERGSTCVFRLSALPDHPTIEALLIERGYTIENPNLVLAQNAMDPLDGSEANIVELALDDWLDTTFRIDPVDDPNLKAWQRQVLSRGVLPRRYVVVMHDGEACGYGYSTRQGNRLNLNDLWVRPTLRGQGLGTRLMQGLLQLGAKDGAEVACLAVNEPNTRAQRLYERLGFVKQYQYRYLEPQE